MLEHEPNRKCKLLTIRQREDVENDKFTKMCIKDILIIHSNNEILLKIAKRCDNNNDSYPEQLNKGILPNIINTHSLEKENYCKIGNAQQNK